MVGLFDGYQAYFTYADEGIKRNIDRVQHNFLFDDAYVVAGAFDDNPLWVSQSGIYSPAVGVAERVKLTQLIDNLRADRSVAPFPWSRIDPAADRWGWGVDQCIELMMAVGITHYLALPNSPVLASWQPILDLGIADKQSYGDDRSWWCLFTQNVIPTVSPGWPDNIFSDGGNHGIVFSPYWWTKFLTYDAL